MPRHLAHRHAERRFSAEVRINLNPLVKTIMRRERDTREVRHQIPFVIA
jgi:hypothetical protein